MSKIEPCIPQARIYGVELRRVVEIAFAPDIIALGLREQKGVFERIEIALHCFIRDARMRNGVERVRKLFRIGERTHCRGKFFGELLQCKCVVDAIALDDIRLVHAPKKSLQIGLPFGFSRRENRKGHPSIHKIFGPRGALIHVRKIEELRKTQRPHMNLSGPISEICNNVA